MQKLARNGFHFLHGIQNGEKMTFLFSSRSQSGLMEPSFTIILIVLSFLLLGRSTML